MRAMCCDACQKYLLMPAPLRVRACVRSCVRLQGKGVDGSVLDPLLSVLVQVQCRLPFLPPALYPPTRSPRPLSQCVLASEPHCSFLLSPESMCKISPSVPFVSQFVAPRLARASTSILCPSPPFRSSIPRVKLVSPSLPVRVAVGAQVPHPGALRGAEHLHVPAFPALSPSLLPRS